MISLPYTVAAHLKVENPSLGFGSYRVLLGVLGEQQHRYPYNFLYGMTHLSVSLPRVGIFSA